MSRFPPDLFAGSRFAVVGLGRNGLPAARGLAAMGAEVIAWDDADTGSSLPPRIERRLPRAGERFDALVLSPGIPHRLPRPHPAAVLASAEGWPILSDAELLFRAVHAAGSRARFIGITGTNGKSTTSALLAHVLAGAGISVAAGGNLGPAALGLPLLAHDGVYVLEMSSYMLERIATLRFDAAAMLNLSPDHLDRHGDMAGYAAAKRAIFARQQPGDLAVVGIDDAASRAMASWLAEQPPRLRTISGVRSADVWCDCGMLRDADGPISAMAAAFALPGTHNAQNAAAVAALALGLGVARTDIARGISSFPGLPHRQQHVAEVADISFVNDSKATNADAAARALACYERVVWIAGGIAKEGGIAALTPRFGRIARALLIGRDAPALAATLTEFGVPHEIAGTLDNAVPAALAAARATGAPVVLLSPACASFDQFTGFDARGDRFIELVQNLKQEHAA
jgi:UDP-N-acetylmuramoylalanine--D-glutamate ligase